MAYQPLKTEMNGDTVSDSAYRAAVVARFRATHPDLFWIVLETAMGMLDRPTSLSAETVALGHFRVRADCGPGACGALERSIRERVPAGLIVEAVPA